MIDWVARSSHVKIQTSVDQRDTSMCIDGVESERKHVISTEAVTLMYNGDHMM